MTKKSALVLLLTPLFYIYSYFLISNYTFGDQLSYRALYHALSYSDFSDVIDVSNLYITANDELSFYILWLGASAGIDKDIFISLFNTFLLLGLYFFSDRYGVNKTMFFLVATNFYVVVLMTGAERLKFAFILLIFAEIARSKWLRVTLSFLSISAHLQSLILLCSTILGSYSQSIVSNFRHGKLPIRLFFVFFIIFLSGVMVAYDRQADIELKFNSYALDGFGVSELFQIFFLLVAAVYFAENKIALLFSLIPLGVAVIILGGQRINMIAVVVVVYFFWKERKPNHPLMYILMIYFSAKSIPFIANIINYGNGFYGV